MKAEEAYQVWWREQTRTGDPNHRPHLVRDAFLAAYGARLDWQPIESAPKDGTWILLRGRTMGGDPMIPVVAAFRPIGAAHHGDSWVDSRGFVNCDSLAAEHGADWHSIPE